MKNLFKQISQISKNSSPYFILVIRLMPMLLARGSADIDAQHKEFIRTSDAVPRRIAWRTLMSWPHLGLTTFALVSLLLMSQGRAQAQVIHEKAAWPALATAPYSCKTLPFTVTGPGRLTVRLKMNPYYNSEFIGRTEPVVQAEALPYIATGKGWTINGLPNEDPTKWFGKPVEQIGTWEFGGGKKSAAFLFCNAIVCTGSGCRQRATTVELIVDWTAANAGVTESTGGDRLGHEWSEIEAGIPGRWVRRGNSNIWDARWNNGAVAVLTISIAGDKVRIIRKDVGITLGLTAIYEGTLAPDGTMQGTETYTWPGHFTNKTQQWQGRIVSPVDVPPDRLGHEWSEIEAGIAGRWVRRGKSNIWDARWNNGAVAVLTITISGNKVMVDRKDVGGPCTAKYEGTVAPDNTIHGTQTANCGGADFGQKWEGRIVRR